MKIRYIKIFLIVAGFTLLIIDTKTATMGIQSGIGLCLQSVIPSLLPFIILSKYLTSQLYGIQLPFLSPLGKLCGIPEGLESIMAVGLIGGYPIGAQLITDAWKKGICDEKTAIRMLGFCNNAGPAFIFGVCAELFNIPCAGWLILLIQTASSICCGIILPGKERAAGGKVTLQPITFVKNVELAIRAMISICSWILCFRIIISYVDHYVTMNNPIFRTSLLSALELVNGCTESNSVVSEPIRFIIVNAILSFGGLCVWMQTAATVGGLSMKWFCFGKIMQCIFSATFASMMQFLIYKHSTIAETRLIPILGVIIITGLFAGKIVVAFLKKMLYDKSKKYKSRWQYAVSQKY